MPRMKRTITACLLVKSHRKGVFGKEGKAAAITCGMVSPTIIQKANMPPKALYATLLEFSRRDGV